MSVAHRNVGSGDGVGGLGGLGCTRAGSMHSTQLSSDSRSRGHTELLIRELMIALHNESR